MVGHGVTPLTNRQAWDAYDALLTDERVAFRAAEIPVTENLWRQYSSRGTASPKLWMDAYLAAFAAAGRMTLVTTDAAFRQFDGLDVLVLGEDAPAPV